MYFDFHSEKTDDEDISYEFRFVTSDEATKNISLLHTRLVTDKTINYFEVGKDSIDSVLDIFVRVNSGGTVLSKSDLLFSTIVSHWDKTRDEIDKLLSEINKKGEGFKFSNDFIRDLKKTKLKT